MFINNIIKMDVFYFLNCFFIYSFFGWIFECIVIAFQEKSIENRGFIKGPLCTIYGVAALGAYFLLKPISHNLLLLFLTGAVMATIFEILVAKVMTYLFGYFWWDYTNRPFNYHGVICLESTLCWGAMTAALFMFFQPFVESIVNVYYESAGKAFAVVALALYCIDFSTSFYRAWGERTEFENELETEQLESSEA